MVKKKRKKKLTHTITRTRAKFIKKEVIMPRSHTVVHLNKRGQKAMKKLTDKEKRWLALDGTGGGGIYGNSKLYFGHDIAVHKRWRKVQALLSKGHNRKRKPREPKKGRWFN